ncbi:acetyl-CoA synthetase-like protein [Myriangium duriaei CBS 260.36]|uniref:Acetyl-CoA synthetase-like protein n=1 Tax=Myriangium duriaei CBS 260.36 TaxID=1168546 RepID=A0A9P4MJ39_9PEZI|nr:acetyl-CoA synthetase-like protein [Myriangium duriaei CBS 260.36]
MSTTTATITQALSSTGSGSSSTATTQLHTISDLIRQRALDYKSHPAIGYPRKGVDDFEEHSFEALDRYVDAAVDRLQQIGIKPADATLVKAPVIAMLARSGIHTIVIFLALNRLGYAVMQLSTRLACPAIVRLLELTDCTRIMTTQNFHGLLEEVQKHRQLDVLPLLAHEDYLGRHAAPLRRKYDPAKETNKVAMIIHSSGSTGLPKPIFLTNHSCIAMFSTHLNRRGLLTSPMFHNHGFAEMFRAIHSGKPIYLCNYALPLTGHSVLKMIEKVKPEILHSVPYIIKLVAEMEGGIEALAGIDVVLYAGSGCPEDLGDRLVQHGVNLCGNYGSTEVGRLATSLRPKEDKLWNYLRPLPKAKPFIYWREESPGLFECVTLDGWPSKSTNNSDDPPNSFRTRDLFVPHPTIPDLWKYVSRVDDRLTLINGEKVLPLPMEGTIRHDRLVKEAIVFGEEQSFPGVFVIKADSVSDMSDEEYLEKIWPSIELANSRAEGFARMPKELVGILPADIIYPRTDKGTCIRKAFYQQFEEQIQALYERFEGTEGGSLRLGQSDLEHYLLKSIEENLRIKLPCSQTDFFAAGIDSLQCIKLWKTLKANLDLGGRQKDLSQNVLYETGNVSTLAKHLIDLREGTIASSAGSEVEIMERLIEKYSHFSTHKRGSATQPTKQLVLLTGVTGGLGAHLLAELVSQPDVAEVWALVRANDESAATERVAKSLATRGISLSAEAQAKVTSLPTDLSRGDLSLSEKRLTVLRERLTMVIHSAWAVNFNISVQSFEDQHIKAVHNLIELCQGVQTPLPARFFFCSSVSSAAGSPRPGVVTESPVPGPENAQNTGYARSKYVAEHVTQNAMRRANAVTRVLRIGQLIGDTKSGEWNVTEGIPLMIQTAVTVGALPALDEEMTWLPVDYAAKGIVELASHQSEDVGLTYHVINPMAFHWTRDMLPALSQAGLEFKILPTAEWMELLRNSDKDPKKNPPIKLLDWFEGKYGNKRSGKPQGKLVYLTDVTLRDSKALGSVPSVVDVDFVRLMLERLKAGWNA